MKYSWAAGGEQCLSDAGGRPVVSVVAVFASIRASWRSFLFPALGPQEAKPRPPQACRHALLVGVVAGGRLRKELYRRH